MATINATLPSLLDVSKRLSPTGGMTDIVETLTLQNPILQDAVWQEGNLPTGHIYTSRTGLPSVAWRRLNEGVAPGKSVVDNITESCGMLAGLAVVDVDMAKLSGNEAEFRASEDKAFLQSFNNEFASALFYSSTKATPEKIHGLQPRLNQLPTGTTATWRNQVVTASGAATLTSMYLVNWSPDGVFCITPKGGGTGLSMKDMGEQLWNDANSNKFRAYVTAWEWKVGLVVKDYRKVARVCNIRTDDLAKAGSGTSGFLFDPMLKAHYQVDGLSAGRPAWYCNRTIAHWLHAQSTVGPNTAQISVDLVEGRPVTSHLGIPIKVCDAILNSESTVTTST